MKYSFNAIQKLFIFDRREMFVLTVLGLIIGLFNFTLGIHLGKAVGTKIESSGNVDPKIVASISDQIPSNQELIGPNKVTQQALDESLNQTLHDEVVRSNVHLNPVFQTELPENAKTSNAGATTLKALPAVDEKPVVKTDRKMSSVDEAPKSPMAKKGEPYSIQIGSFPSREEAQKRVSELVALELQPTLKEVSVKGKGTWFRLYLGGFQDAAAAEKEGKSYVAQHKIKSFIVSKVTD